MKKKLALAGTVILITAAFTPVDTPVFLAYRPERPRTCSGYTIIEYGKAINCDGDTIQLVKRNGVQVFIAKPRTRQLQLMKVSRPEDFHHGSSQ